VELFNLVRKIKDRAVKCSDELAVRPDLVLDVDMIGKLVGTPGCDEVRECWSLLLIRAPDASLDVVA
jgi:hypothetical protein